MYVKDEVTVPRDEDAMASRPTATPPALAADRDSSSTRLPGWMAQSAVVRDHRQIEIGRRPANRLALAFGAERLPPPANRAVRRRRCRFSFKEQPEGRSFRGKTSVDVCPLGGIVVTEALVCARQRSPQFPLRPYTIFHFWPDGSSSGQRTKTFSFLAKK